MADLYGVLHGTNNTRAPANCYRLLDEAVAACHWLDDGLLQEWGARSCQRIESQHLLRRGHQDGHCHRCFTLGHRRLFGDRGQTSVLILMSSGSRRRASAADWDWGIILTASGGSLGCASGPQGLEEDLDETADQFAGEERQQMEICKFKLYPVTQITISFQLQDSELLSDELASPFLVSCQHLSHRLLPFPEMLSDRVVPLTKSSRGACWPGLPGEHYLQINRQVGEESGSHS